MEEAKKEQEREEEVMEAMEEKDKSVEGKPMKEDIFGDKKGLLLIAGGALVALAVIGAGKISKKMKPALVSAVKEGYAFKEWLVGKYEAAKEDVEDIVAEAKYAYHKDIEATEETVKKEKAAVEKVEEVIKKRTQRKNTEKAGE